MVGASLHEPPVEIVDTIDPNLIKEKDTENEIATLIIKVSIVFNIIGKTSHFVLS